MRSAFVLSGSDFSSGGRPCGHRRRTREALKELRQNSAERFGLTDFYGTSVADKMTACGLLGKVMLWTVFAGSSGNR